MRYLLTERQAGCYCGRVTVDWLHSYAATRSALVDLTINGKPTTIDAPADMPLLWALRDIVGLTGTKFGCGAAQCGACTVHVDGVAVRSCLMLAVQAGGADVTTVEGLARGGRLHALQQAFVDSHALQCGFCTPGFLVTALELLREDASPSEETIREAISGNLCRCTGYVNIVKAIRTAAETLADGAAASTGRGSPHPSTTSPLRPWPRRLRLSPRPRSRRCSPAGRASCRCSHSGWRSRRCSSTSTGSRPSRTFGKRTTVWRSGR